MNRIPIIHSQPKIRRSRSTRWRVGVLFFVHVAIAVHIAQWLVTGRTLTPVEPSEAAALAISGVINTGLVFFAVTIALTAVFGRFFCGWGCHLVALQDLSRGLLEKFGHRPKPLRSRALAWVPMIAFVYAFLWPAMYRFAVGQPMPELQTEFTTTQFWSTFPGWIIGIATFVVCGFLTIYFLGAKGFCTYACPYGAIFGVAEKVAPLRIRVTDACRGCGHCTAVCTSNVRVHEEVRDFGMVVDSGCMKCLDCVSVCPNDALYYGSGPIPLVAKQRAHGRKMKRFPLSLVEECIAALGFVAGFFVFRGLYGEIPFLMALGLAGVLAYLTLLTFQVATKRNWRFKSWPLKKGGRLQRPAFVFLLLMALFTAFWIHCGVVRYYTYLGDNGYRAARAWAPRVLDVTLALPTLDAASVHRIYRGFAAFQKVEDLGLISSRGLDAKLAWMASLLGRREALIERAKSAIEHAELSAEMHQLLARFAFDNGEFGEASEALRAAIAAEPDNLNARLGLGISQARQGSLAAAEVTFLEAIDRFGEKPELLYNLGLVDAYAGAIDSAIDRFAAVLSIDPDHLPARENLAGMLATVGRFEESVQHYQLAIEQSPDDPQTRVFLAQVLIALGLVGQAHEQVDAALRISPEFPPALQIATHLPPRD